MTSADVVTLTRLLLDAMRYDQFDIADVTAAIGEAERTLLAGAIATNDERYARPFISEVYIKHNTALEDYFAFRGAQITVDTQGAIFTPSFVDFDTYLQYDTLGSGSAKSAYCTVANTKLLVCSEYRNVPDPEVDENNVRVWYVKTPYFTGNNLLAPMEYRPTIALLSATILNERNIGDNARIIPQF
jgi:hypothetical protein